MNARISSSTWDGTERRSTNSCRRKNPDRRRGTERRHDPRHAGKSRRRSIIAWFRSLTRNRLGVDRRKGGDQRMYDRRCSGPRSLLTQEELEALLK